jgi:hypothetical protein
MAALRQLPVPGPASLDRRPQMIDQRLAVANFPALFDTGQSIPQCQQPLAAERRHLVSRSTLRIFRAEAANQ